MHSHVYSGMMLHEEVQRRAVGCAACCPPVKAPWTASTVSVWRLALAPLVFSIPFAIASCAGAFWATFSADSPNDNYSSTTYAFSLEKLYSCDDLAFCTDFFDDNPVALSDLPGGDAVASASQTALVLTVLMSFLPIASFLRLLIARVASSPACACCRACLPICGTAYVRDDSLTRWTLLTAVTSMLGSAAGIAATVGYASAGQAWQVNYMASIASGARNYYLGAGLGCACAAAALQGIAAIMLLLVTASTCMHGGGQEEAGVYAPLGDGKTVDVRAGGVLNHAPSAPPVSLYNVDESTYASAAMMRPPPRAYAPYAVASAVMDDENPS